MNDNELPLELQQQPNSTYKTINDGYSMINEQLSPAADYDIPDNYMPTSCQDHTYTSLRNPEVVDHGYAKPIRSEQSINVSQGTSEQGSHEYDSVIRQDENQAVPHKVHHYTSLTNLQPPTRHVYAERERSEKSATDSTKGSPQCLQEYY